MNAPFLEHTLAYLHKQTADLRAELDAVRKELAEVKAILNSQLEVVVNDIKYPSALVPTPPPTLPSATITAVAPEISEKGRLMMAAHRREMAGNAMRFL